MKSITNSSINVELSMLSIFLAQFRFCSSVCTVLLNLILWNKLGARSLGATPLIHLDSQNGVFLPSATNISVELKNKCLSVWSVTLRTRQEFYVIKKRLATDSVRNGAISKRDYHVYRHQMDNYNLLFLAISSVALSDNKDKIISRWSANGKFTEASAYDYQFYGAMALFPAAQVWKAYAQPKCKLFAWLVLHNRALTTDNMAQKNWPCNPIY
jgi:hypothetical protein